MLGEGGWRLNAYLLLGGRSDRFGADRAQARLDGRTLEERAQEALARAVGEGAAVRGVGPAAARAGRSSWLDDATAVPPGPGAGLLAVLRDGGGLVLGVDMPCVPASTLQVLPFLGQERPAAPVVAGRVLALCAWWPPGALPAMEAAMANDGGRPEAAFARARGVRLSLEELGVREEDAWLFTSVRSPYDLRQLERLVLARGGLWS